MINLSCANRPGLLVRTVLKLAGFGIAVACSVPNQAAAQTKPLKKVTIAVGTQVLNVSYPWLMMPIAKGYWREEGYDVQVLPVQGSLQALQQMAAGAVDMAELNSTALVQANADNNLPVRGIMGNGVIDWGLAVDAGSPIKNVKELAGKNIGIVSLATGGVALLKGYLRANGLNPDTDVNIIPTGAGAPALDALRSNRVQATMFWDSALVGFSNGGMKLRIFRDPQWRRMPDLTLSTLQKTIDADPALVEAIVRGAAKATLFAMTNPDCTRKIHWAAFPHTKPTGADEAKLAEWDLNLLNAQLGTMRDAQTLHGGKLIGNIDPAAYGRMEDFMVQAKLVSKTVPAAAMIINRPGFFEAVNKFDHQKIINDAKACTGI
jgi:NitT/TauT family transport system substrate-binding protein